MLSERVADFAWRHGDPQMRFNRLTVYDVPFLSEEYAGSLARARLAEAVRHETATRTSTTATRSSSPRRSSAELGRQTSVWLWH